ncbi:MULTISPECIES: hypothetical protein [Idiomarina]|uniref:hypothetical protein n=1 Tax=Idiomarina TaxID=135575 RepID=UPI00258B0312|nr:hypothetical protein [Idiomarina sp.]
MNEQSSIIGSGSVDIRTEGHTQIDGAVIANIDEEGNDGGNLSLDTGTLAYNDIEDHDQEKSTYLNVGFTMGDDNSTNQSESGTNYTASGHYNNHDKEQINRATVGEGTIVVRDNTEQDTSDLNRDTDLAQEVTKDDSQNTNLYASTTAVDSLTNLAENPSEQLNQWKENVTSALNPEAWEEVADNVKEVPKKSQVAYILLTEEASAGRDIKITAIDEAGMTWSEAESLLERDDVRAVAEAADKFDDVLAWAPDEDIDVPVQTSVIPDEEPSANSGVVLEIVLTEGADGKLRAVVDVAGDVAEQLEQVDPRIANVVELGLVAAQGVKGAAQYVAEKALENTALGEAWSQLTQDAGIAISNAATLHDEESRARFAGNEAEQQNITHMDKGGTLLAGVILGVAGSGGITSAIKGISNRKPSLPDSYTRNPDGSIHGPGQGKAIDSGHTAPDGSPIYERTAKDGSGSSSYYWVDESGAQRPVESPRPKTEIGEQYAHHKTAVDKTAENLRAQDFDVKAEVRVFSSCGSTYCKPDIVYRNADGQVGFIEVKTGNGPLTTRQKEIFEKVGENDYRISPDRILSRQAADAIGADYQPGLTISEAGYPNGIPVIIQREPGLGG